MKKKHIDHLVCSMGEVIGDYLDAGYPYESIGEVIECNIGEYVTSEDITVDYNELATALQKRITTCSEGWTLDEIRFFKKFFEKYGVAFEVKV